MPAAKGIKTKEKGQGAGSRKISGKGQKKVKKLSREIIDLFTRLIILLICTLIGYIFLLKMGQILWNIFLETSGGIDLVTDSYETYEALNRVYAYDVIGFSANIIAISLLVCMITGIVFQLLMIRRFFYEPLGGLGIIIGGAICGGIASPWVAAAIEMDKIFGFVFGVVPCAALVDLCFKLAAKIIPEMDIIVKNRFVTELISSLNLGFLQKKDGEAEIGEEDYEEDDEIGEDLGSIIEKVDALQDENKTDQAYRAIKSAVKGKDIHDLSLYDRYYGLIKIKKNTEEILEHGANYIQLLALHNQSKKACNVYMDCVALNKSFLVEASALYKLGNWFSKAGKNKIAIHIYKLIIKKYPKDPVTPNTYFQAAQLFHGKFRDAPRARQLLKLLLEQYPNHEVVDRVKIYMQHM